MRRGTSLFGEKEQTHKVFHALRVCSFCLYKSLGLAHLRLTSQMRCSHLVMILKFSAKNITHSASGSFMEKEGAVSNETARLVLNEMCFAHEMLARQSYKDCSQAGNVILTVIREMKQIRRADLFHFLFSLRENTRNQKLLSRYASASAHQRPLFLATSSASVAKRGSFSPKAAKSAMAVKGILMWV